MKLQYWGTAAAEGIPALFCHCDTCRAAKERGGRNVRTRSQAVLDDTLLLDFPADTYCHSLRYGADLASFTHLLITHSHSDHLYSADFTMRRDGFAHIGSAPALEVYGAAGAIDYAKIEGDPRGDDVGGTVHFRKLLPYTHYDIAGYDVVALPARHDPKSFPYVYRIGKGEKGLFYCNDTGPLFDEVWEFLEREKLPMTFVSADCTDGARAEMGYDSHMCLARNIDLRDRLLKIGCADEKTLFCCTHFSHNGEHALYDEYSEIAKKEGFLTAYDGMTVEF